MPQQTQPHKGSDSDISGDSSCWLIGILIEFLKLVQNVSSSRVKRCGTSALMAAFIRFLRARDMKKSSIDSETHEWGNRTKSLSYEIKSSVEQLIQCLANEGLMAIYSCVCSDCILHCNLPDRNCTKHEQYEMMPWVHGTDMLLWRQEFTPRVVGVIFDPKKPEAGYLSGGAIVWKSRQSFEKLLYSQWLQWESKQWQS